MAGSQPSSAALLLATTVLAGCASEPPTAPGPDSPELLWELETGGVPLEPLPDRQGRPFLYAALKEGGLVVLELPASGGPSDPVAVLDPADFEGLNVTTLDQQGTLLYVGLGDFFAVAGSRAGLAIVDVADPRNPTILSQWTSPSVMTGVTSVLVDGGTAFVAAKRDGVLIFDVSQPTAPALLASFLPDIHFPRADPPPTSHPNARGFAISGNLLFVANDAGGLRVFDVSDRTDPREIAKYINPGLGDKPQAYNNVVVASGMAYVALDYCGLEILDVSDPLDIRQLGWWNPWNCHTLANVWFNSPGHTNEIHFDPARRRILLSAGDSELVIIDVADPRNPFLIDQFGEPGNGQAVWGVSARGTTAYLTYIIALVPYRGTWAGIRAVSIP